jgi:hypothetical protein
MPSLVRRLDGLPVTLAPPARTYAAWFEGLGCHTLGELQRLPRPGLQRRCGRALLDLLDAAYGLSPELFEWIVAPDAFQARLELFDRIDNADLPLEGSKRLLLRPTWLLAKPIALLMRDHRPFYGSPLRMASNPERIEAGWWNGPQTRDYFIAEGKDHTLYWVYRERLGAGEEEPRWFLHGLFG